MSLTPTLYYFGASAVLALLSTFLACRGIDTPNNERASFLYGYGAIVCLVLALAIFLFTLFV